MPVMIFSLVSNFGDQSLVYPKIRLVVENTSALECDKFQTICKYIKNRPSANKDSIGKGSSILPLKQTNIK